MHRIRTDIVITLVLTAAAQAAPEVSWTPADGLPCHDCPGTDWVLMELPFEHDHELVVHYDGLLALHVVDWSDTSYSRANTNLFSPTSDEDAVYEFTAQTVSGTWLSGFHDYEKSMALSVAPDRVGFQIDAQTWAVFVEVDTTDQLHTFRVEKHGQDFVRVKMDGVTLFQVGYDAMPEEPWPGAGFTYANSGALVRTCVETEAELYVREYRHLVGATSFPDDPSGPRNILWAEAEMLAYD